MNYVTAIYQDARGDIYVTREPLATDALNQRARWQEAIAAFVTLQYAADTEEVT